jgi:hypothetical protein
MPFADSRLGPGTLKLGPADPPVTEFNTQTSAVRLTPSVDSEDGTPTLAVPEPAPLSTITWALNIDAIQDFTEATGLVNYLMDNALDEQFFEWVPLTSDGTKYEGKVQIIPIEIGGDVAVQVVTSVELPLVGAPTRTDGVAAVAAGGSGKRPKAEAA